MGLFQRPGKRAQVFVFEDNLKLGATKCDVKQAAGHALHDGMSFILWQVIVAGALVTMLPVLMSLTLGRFLLKLRPVDVWGSVCGGMTSSAALGAVKRASDSNEPAVSYAAAFAVASVIVTVAGQVVIRFLS